MERQKLLFARDVRRKSDSLTSVSSGGETMRRREFGTLIAGWLVAWPFTSMAQEVGRTYLVGQLSPFPRHAAFNITFYEELRRSGFIEGKNLTIYYRDYGLHGDLISQYAAELVKAQALSFLLAVAWQFALHSRRLKRFRSSGPLMIWSGRD
jgi:hypothetical protein